MRNSETSDLSGTLSTMPYTAEVLSAAALGVRRTSSTTCMREREREKEKEREREREKERERERER